MPRESRERRPGPSARTTSAADPPGNTLKQSVRVSGRGMHTGMEGRVDVNPAPPGSGVVFVSGAGRIPARAAFVVGTRRCTSLSSGEARVDTVEHLLAALYALRVDDAEIVIEGPEVPALDGSALPWVDALLAAGTVASGEPAPTLRLSRPLVYEQGGSWVAAAPAEAFSMTCVTRYDHALLGTQVGTFGDDPAAFARDVAPARTFGFIEEVEALRASHLALGGSLENALIVYPDHFSDRLRVPDECLRHKVVDLFGDLSLAGARIQASITAIKPGHAVNTAFAAMLAERMTEAR